jgi:hypothetical protein
MGLSKRSTEPVATFIPSLTKLKPLGSPIRSGIIWRASLGRHWEGGKQRLIRPGRPSTGLSVRLTKRVATFLAYQIKLKKLGRPTWSGIIWRASLGARWKNGKQRLIRPGKLSMGLSKRSTEPVATFIPCLAKLKTLERLIWSGTVWKRSSGKRWGLRMNVLGD